MNNKSWSKWTPEVIARFSNDYPSKSWEYLIGNYPFSKETMITKASELGIKRLIGRPKRYTADDDKFIVDCFNNGMSDEEIALKLGRSASGIETRRERIGLHLRKGQWTDEEEVILVANYDKMPVLDVATLLPGRSSDAIIAHALLLDLTGYKPYHEYTDAEESYIREHYLLMSDDDIALALGHPRASIKNRRNLLGLHRPKNQTKLRGCKFLFSEIQ